MEKQINNKFSIIFLVVLIAVSGFIILKSISTFIPTFPPFIPKTAGITKFSSEEDFKEYLENVELGYYYGGGIFQGRETFSFMENVALAPTVDGKGGGGEERVSTTNVQVVGIDEPDVVKTDGREIYFSSGSYYYWRPFIEEIMPPYRSGETKLIKSFPPTDLKIDSKIDKTGDLLLKDDVLAILSGDKISGFDISDTKSPEKKWTIELESNNYLVGARLYKDKIYLITKTQIDTYRPCPIKPLSIEGKTLEIKCVDIYHPIAQVPIDVTYSAMILNPDLGKIEKTISFVGNSDSSVVYMSEGSIYVTYSYFENTVKFFTKFFKEKCEDIISSWVIEKLEKLQDYDISDSSKMAEFQIILQRFYNSLDNDERLKIENEINNRMDDYFKDHKRELETTGIIKISSDKLEITANGAIPGRPLNQFSLDEYDSYLRIATTVGENMFWWGIGGTRESANDVYILDKKLEISGSIKDLGLEERIYSARFVEDKGYLVTFRQTDPFYVLDLSNPERPELKGELKIPGYSSFLYPITKDKILGIGKEDANVKISLFDVGNPKNPTEIDKYTLDEYWSDILNTHHAFLIDKKHEIFFLPGGRGGYVFSYKGNELKLERAVSDITAKRAIYINDYLYIIGEDKIIVLNELNWEKINEIEF